MTYKLVKNVKEIEEIRKSFIELTQKIFGFSFTDWYENQYWQDQYIPYSLVDGDKVIANVSVNIMNFIIDGVQKKYIQLGTVMTEETYRNQGLGRYIMEQVLEEYKDGADGIYLFANDSALNFYPKFGFRKAQEYKYSKIVDLSKISKKVKKLDLNQPAVRERLLDTVRNMAVNNKLHMNNDGLYTFWLTGAMSDQIYYCEQVDAYAVGYLSDDVLFLNQVVSKYSVDLDKVIACFGSEVKKVVLGFVPIDTSGYKVEELKEEDVTLFILGEDLKLMDKQKLRFPVLSHA